MLELCAGAGAESCPSKGVHFDGHHIDQLVLYIRTVATHVWVAPGHNLLGSSRTMQALSNCEWLESAERKNVHRNTLRDT